MEDIIYTNGFKRLKFVVEGHRWIKYSQYAFGNTFLNIDNYWGDDAAETRSMLDTFVGKSIKAADGITLTISGYDLDYENGIITMTLKSAELDELKKV